MMMIFSLGRLFVGVLAVSTIFDNCSGCGGSSNTPSTTSTPTPAFPVSSHAASSADAFVDSIGVNTHLGTTYYPPSALPTINTAIQQLGIRHLRDSAYATGQQPAICAEDVTLAALGPRFDFISSQGMTAADINSWNACVGGATEAFEAFNEYDISHPQSDTNWPQTLQAFQQTLYATIKQNASTANVTVLAPSLTTASAAQSVGNLESYLDYGNIHAYFAGFLPETGGFGANGYGSLSYNKANGAFVAGTKPSFITETSYSTGGIINSVDDTTQAKYIDRVLLNDYANGIVRTDLYELVDEPVSQPPTFALAGLLDQSFNRKASYNQLKNTIALLSDAGAAVTTSPLTYGISGSTTNLETVLLQKRNGDYYLACWLADSSYDTNAIKPTTVDPQNITINLSVTPRFASISSFDASGAIRTTTAPAALAVPVTVTDNVQFVRLSVGP